MVQAGAIVHLGSGLIIYGDYYRGIGWHFEDFNWNDQPDVRADDVPRPLAHGNFPSETYLESRDLNMPGFVVAKSHSLLLKEKNKLNRLRRRIVRVTVEEPGLTTWADAEVRAVAFDDHGFAPEARFRLSLYMADPRKYGKSERVFSSGETVFHRGNADAAPDVTVTGNMPSGYSIQGPGGKHYDVAQALGAGQTHRIDFETGYLYRNGALQPATAVSRAETWLVPPGTGFPMTLAPASGTGTLATKVPYTST
ncbi:hypothetical protein [Microbacterium sp. 4-7]|uniref:hypothetical protein n=1 Tax=Microbacterium sp. 4-7 TaxID=1885327 RepID=UPI00164F4CB8|nr:hypothetical protein [Microbacterium sp. 4-7]MBC6496112.1 hypothetical protein [Microbacterium sp. 4-7]